MPAPLQYPRVDTLKLKVHIERKLGHEKSDKYFLLLKQYLTCKLSKSEFDCLCIRVIGRDNICIHNHFVQAILRNTIVAESSPKGIRSGLNLQSFCRDAFPLSPRKGRTPNLRDRKFRHRFSPLNPHGKSHIAICEDSVSKFKKQRNVNVTVTVTDMLSERSRVIRAPFGISIKGKQMKRKRKKKKILHGGSELLPDSISLKARLEEHLVMEGFTISMDCVNLLNCGLDVYLKRLILPSLELASSQMSTTMKLKRPIFASLLDFQVALEANPKILGEDWPVQLERICSHSPAQN
ncbi:uncharacterized protein LOC124916816 [Impatiens glandulifera]|uniref:uncharacterized protein LOC124916816 n=1 Tax=Impatiens glandulifera TaxID=253017 RepID=UPI001FB0D562|nr:uncharacterized protein LOC124916816 [Impatiens glandulifera]XP_047313539.1 uncharacterized protein LOC124916816 [Impatiens glandulifera]